MVTQKIAMASLPDHIKEKIKKYPTNTKESSKKGKALNWRIKYPYKKNCLKYLMVENNGHKLKKTSTNKVHVVVVGHFRYVDYYQIDIIYYQREK